MTSPDLLGTLGETLRIAARRGSLTDHYLGVLREAIRCYAQEDAKTAFWAKPLGEDRHELLHSRRLMHAWQSLDECRRVGGVCARSHRNLTGKHAVRMLCIGRHIRIEINFQHMD